MLPNVALAGRAESSHGAQQQHVDLYRKIILRRKMFALAEPGAVYVPFIGDGDIAAQVYTDRRIYGADIDAKRVATARARFKRVTIIKADCNRWPFPEVTARFAVADFDSYSDPYASFRSFWQHAKKMNHLILFFTDGHRQMIKRSGNFTRPDGVHINNLPISERRMVYNFYFPRHILPWFKEFIQPYQIVKVMNYYRRDMIYWGAAIEQT